MNETTDDSKWKATAISKGAILEADRLYPNNLRQMPSPTFKAKLFEVPWDGKSFKLAGTLDGFVDLAVPGGGTYLLTPAEVQGLVAALSAAIADVEANCLHERDSLLIPRGERP